MGYRLNEAVYFCIAGTKTTWLDLRDDAYFQLADGEEAAFQAYLSGSRLTATDTWHLLHLTDLGVLVADASCLTPPAPVTVIMPVRSLLDGPSPSVSFWPLALALYYHVQTILHLATQPIWRIFGRLRVQKLKHVKLVATALPAEIARTVGAFSAASLLLSSSQTCLRRSIAMVDYLHARGIVADLVVGIKDRPFEAHAWVQYGDLVLNDPFDKVLEYTPLVVV
jgi:hypothetical protein